MLVTSPTCPIGFLRTNITLLLSFLSENPEFLLKVTSESVYKKSIQTNTNSNKNISKIKLIDNRLMNFKRNEIYKYSYVQFKEPI